MSTAALLIGLGVGLVVRPGSGIHASVATLDPQAVKTYVAESQSLHLVDFLLNVIPTTIVQAFAAGDILQVLLVSVLFGLATLKLGQSASPLLHVIDQLGAVLFGMVGLIVRLAPIGAFAAMAFTIGRYGVATLFSLAKLDGGCLPDMPALRDHRPWASSLRPVASVSGSSFATSRKRSCWCSGRPLRNRRCHG